MHKHFSICVSTTGMRLWINSSDKTPKGPRFDSPWGYQQQGKNMVAEY